MTNRPITDIKGVYAAALNCGLRPERPDLAYLYIPNAVAAAGTFTRNAFSAASVQHSREIFSQAVPKAVVVNSGNANAVTGEAGRAHCTATARLAAQLLNLNFTEVAVAATGIIGVPLPIEKVEGGLRRLLAEPLKLEGHLAAQAILTTDTRSKEVFLEQDLNGRRLQVAGMAKGSGMIAPNMATMLAFLATNAGMEKAQLQRLFSAAVADSFNMTSVDSDTSTNDMALIFATGAIPLNPEDSQEIAVFSAMLNEACRKLARLIAADGEGATRLIEVQVSGAPSPELARAVAKQVADSPLVKTALHGANPNWGRIAAALGKNPAWPINPAAVTIQLQGITVVAGGLPQAFDRPAAVTALQAPELQISIALGSGSAAATAWGCDLSKGYIDINVDYN